MKKRWRGLMVAAGVAVLSAVCAVSVSDVSEASTKRFVKVKRVATSEMDTVVKFDDRTKEKVSGVPDVRSLEKSSLIEDVDSYKVYYKDSKVLSVTAFGQDGPISDAGYYAAEFAIAGTTKEVFITGLSANNLQTIQDRLVKSYIEGEKFSLEDIEFIDTEKAGIEGMEDSDLCWAGQTSNMLHYTGWGKMAGFETCDDVFDSFASSFVNEGGIAVAGTGWFFNGINFGIDFPETPLKKENTGGYLNDYAYDQVAEGYMLRPEDTPTKGKYSCTQLAKKLLAAMKKGYGTGVDIYNREVGHALTVFGLITDSAYEDSVRKHYYAIILADSDDDKTYIDDRRSLVNHYIIEPLKPQVNEESNSKSWMFPDYGMALGDIQVIKGPSEVKPETDPKATKSKKTTADLCIPTASMSTSFAADLGDDILESGKDISLRVMYKNVSEVRAKGINKIRAEILDADGKSVQTVEQSEDIDESERNNVIISKPIAIKPLSAGKYKLVVTLNAGKDLKEAYFCNNTSESEFTVADPKIDKDKLSISAKVPDFGDEDHVEAKMTYKGVDELIADGYTVVTSINYLSDDNTWGEWTNFNEDGYDDGTGFTVGGYEAKKLLAAPPQAVVSNFGPKAKFRIKISKKKEPDVYVYSKEYDLLYKKLEFKILTSLADDAFSKLPAGATSLAKGEKMQFRIINSSTYDCGDLTGRYSIRVYSSREEDGEIDEEVWASKEIRLGYGESTDVINFDSWKTPLYGPVYFSILSEYDKPDGSVIEDIRALGYLQIAEKPKTMITFDEDIEDAYDGKITVREAVKYAESTGETVTFDPEIYLGDFVIKKPITIKGNVTIDGFIPGLTDNCAYGAELNAYNKFSFFEVEKGAKLNLNGIIMTSGDSRCGGAIENHGGELRLENCTFKGCNGNEKGGAIYSDGGTIKVNSSVFFSNSAGEGSAIYSRNASVDILNSVFASNSEAPSVIDIGDAPGTIVGSTIVNNYSAADSSGIVMGSKLSLLDCIVAANYDSTDIGDQVTAYGCYLSKVGYEIPEENNCEVGDADKILVIENGEVTYEDIIDDAISVEVAGGHNLYVDIGVKKHSGVYIRSQDGKLQYSKDKSTYFDTGMDAVFDAGEYKVDLKNKKRKNFYGCTATEYINPLDRKNVTVPITMSNTQKAGKPMETKLGHAVTEAMRSMYYVDVAFDVTSEIKVTLKKGKTSNRIVMKSCPDTKTLRVLDLTGKQIKSILEKSLDLALKAQKNKKNDGRVLQVSGITATYKKNNKKGKRITSLKIGKNKYKAKKKYSVVFNPSKSIKKTYTQFKGKSLNMYGFRSDVLVDWLRNCSSSSVKKNVKKARFVKK